MQISGQDPIPVFAQHPHLFDTSNFPPEHPLHSMLGKAELHRMKFEYVDRPPILEYVGLSAKMYSIKFAPGDGRSEEEGDELRKSKGVPRRVVDTQLRHMQFLEVLERPHTKRATFNMIRPRNHQLHTEQVTKNTLSGRDDKRWLCADGRSTHAYGHLANYLELENEDFPMEEL
jgi:hypothetical protein